MSETQRQNRAGRYVSQPGGYRAFIPEPLPPKPPIELRGELQNVLSEADRALGRLDGSITTLPYPDLFIAMYVRKEAVLSSQIEGTQSSLQDVLAAEADVFLPGRPQDVDEVFNYVRAMNHGLRRLEDLPLSVRLLREIHAELLVGARGRDKTPGELRTTQNWIGTAGTPLSDAVFVPPPPHEVSDALSRLERFIHDGSPLPLLIRVGLAHSQFETIHPFVDGNGRLGRLLITFMLCEQGALQKPVLYLSHFFKQHHQEYYDRLQSVRDRGSWEEWLTFFLRGVREVSLQAADTARKILTSREDHRKILTDHLGRSTANGMRVLESLYRRPYVSVDDIRGIIGTTFAAANNLVARLVGHGILHEVTGQKRNRRFVYRDYINLFEEVV